MRVRVRVRVRGWRQLERLGRNQCERSTVLLPLLYTSSLAVMATDEAGLPLDKKALKAAKAAEKAAAKAAKAAEKEAAKVAKQEVPS